MRPSPTPFTVGPPSLNAQQLLLMLMVLLVLAAPLVIFRDTLGSMVAIWNRSETFTHQYLILPISLWLVWRQRAILRTLQPRPFSPALLALALCNLAWLLGGLAEVQVIQQVAVVAIIICTVIALLGWRIAKVIAFPLFFLLLAVPFGEVFIGPLIGFTSDFTVAALQVSGIPVWREGASFVIPSGRWSVVEACSGVRYLIASLTLGILYAHLSYRSRWRQAVFIVVSIIVPIIANGLRAYLIVMIGHLSSMRLAVGVDHLIYGWLFFGLVMFLMFWIGNFWVEAPPSAPAAGQATPAAVRSPHDVPAGKWLLGVLGTLLCLSIGPLYAQWMARCNATSTPLQLSLEQSPWDDGKHFSDWRPDFHPGAAELSRFYQHDGQQVGLFLRYYRDQHPGTTLVSSVNRILTEKNSPWIAVGSDTRSEAVAGRELTLREDLIKGASGDLLIWRWYWIDRRFVENDYLAKLLQAKSQLNMHGDDGAALFIFTPLSEQPDQARQVLRDYLNDNLAMIEASLNRNQH